MDPDSITTDQEFRAALVELMSRRNTIRAVAAETGLSKTTVGELRRRHRAPTLDVVRQLSRAYTPDAAAWERAWRRVYPTARTGPGRPAEGRPIPPARARSGPRQLPAGVEFTGREAELAELDRLLASGSDRDEPLMIAVTGTAGVGKTALVTHWGHRRQDRFPDGTLYLDLQGYDPADPLTSADALAALLQSLPAGAAAIPADLTARAARFRSVLHGRRMLVVLDNAFNAEHVRLLLSGGPTCTTVVTSRDDLAALRDRYGAKPVVLHPLSPEEAVRLLGSLLDRPPSSPGLAAPDLTALARAVAGLPLGLRLAAGWIRDTGLDADRCDLFPDLDVEALDGPARLDLLAGTDARTSMRAVLSWSYRHLAPATARTFRLLGLHPGRDADLPAVAALTGQPAEPTARQLRDLARASMLRTRGPEPREGPPAPAGVRTDLRAHLRVELHAVLKDYALEVTERQDSTEDRAAALTRLHDHLDRSLAAARAAGDRPRQAAVLHDLGLLLTGQGRPEEGVRYLMQSVELAAHLGNHRLAADAAQPFGEPVARTT